MPDITNHLATGFTMMSLNTQAAPSRLHNLASWATKLRYEDVPPDVIERTKDFFLDTIACTLAGCDHAAIKALAELAKKMGPSSGSCEVIPFPDLKTSPAFAALINGACSHVVEQDDLHNSSMMHPVSELVLDRVRTWLISANRQPSSFRLLSLSHKTSKLAGKSFLLHVL